MDGVVKPRRSKFADKLPSFNSQKGDGREEGARPSFRLRPSDETEKSRFSAFSIGPKEFKTPGFAPKKTIGFSFTQKTNIMNQNDKETKPLL